MQRQFRAVRLFRIMRYTSCVLLAGIVGMMLFPPTGVENTNADFVDPGDPTAGYIDLTINNNPLELNLKPVSMDGTFAESTEMNVGVTATNYYGYTLSIIADGNGAGDPTKLFNADSTKCPVDNSRCSLDSISDNIVASEYRNPNDSTEVEAIRNTWGINPNQYMSGNEPINNRGQNVDEVYLPFSPYGIVLNKTYMPGTDSYEIKIGARVDTDVPMGAYENTFIVTAVANAVEYSINYVDPSHEAANMPFGESGNIYSPYVWLSDRVPKREGYYFGGWCEGDYFNNGECSNASKIYQPGDMIVIGHDGYTVILLYAVWLRYPANTVCYDDNGANSATKMGCQTLSDEEIANGEFDLWASNFQRSGYGFLGWSENPYAEIGVDKIYGPMETVSKDLSEGGIKLYAIWKKAETSNGQPVYLQDWNGCSYLSRVSYYGDNNFSVSSNGVIALTDKRDNQVYAIARLVDGNCWMVENLRLEAAGTVGYNINDSSVTNESLSQGYGGAFVGLADSETTDFIDSTTANSLYNTTNIVGINQGNRFPRYNNDNTQNAQTGTSNYSITGNVYSYGNYYTWAAAMANTTDFTSYSDSDAAGTSICPKGWQLPLGVGRTDTNLSFSRLDNWMDGSGNSQYDDAADVQSRKWRSFPNNFLYSGFYSNDGVGDRYIAGSYQSSSVYSDTMNFYELLRDDTFRPGTSFGGRHYGYSIRCVIAP